MDPIILVVSLAIGLMAGLVAGLVLERRGFGVIGNMIVGVTGAYLGGWLASYHPLTAGFGIVGEIILAMLVAVVLICCVALVPRSS